MIVRKLFTLLGFKTDKKGFKEADVSLSKIKQTAIQVAGILIAGKVAKSIANIATETARLAGEIDDVASKLGVSTDALQEFRFAAEKTGVSQRTADLALQRFTRRAAEAAQGTGEAKDALKELGVNLKDANGNLRPTSDLLGDVAEGMKRSKTQGDRLRLSFKLFDSEGAALVNTLKDGREAFNAMTAEARSLGGIMDDELIEVGAEYGDQLQAIMFFLQGVKNVIAKEALPFINRIIERMTTWGKMNRALIRTKLVEFIQRAVLAVRRLLRFVVRLFDGFNELPKASRLFLGVAAAIVVLSIALDGPISKMLLLIGLILLAIEDFEVWQEGGDSLFRRLGDGLEKLQGPLGVIRDIIVGIGEGLNFIIDLSTSLPLSFVEFLSKIATGQDIKTATNRFAQQQRQILDDAFQFIQRSIKGSNTLTGFFNLATGGEEGRNFAGDLVSRTVSGSRFVNPFFGVEQAARAAGGLNQQSSNVFNITGIDADTIAEKVRRVFFKTQEEMNRTTAEVFKKTRASTE